LFDILTSVCRRWDKLNDARYNRRQFSPLPWVRTPPLLRHGQVQTLLDPLIRPNFGKVKKSVTDVSAMSPDMLATAFHYSTLNVNHTCFPDDTVDSPCTLFTFTYLLRSVMTLTSKDCNDILQTFG